MAAHRRRKPPGARGADDPAPRSRLRVPEVPAARPTKAELREGRPPPPPGRSAPAATRKYHAGQIGAGICRPRGEAPGRCREAARRRATRRPRGRWAPPPGRTRQAPKGCSTSDWPGRTESLPQKVKTAKADHLRMDTSPVKAAGHQRCRAVNLIVTTRSRRSSPRTRCRRRHTRTPRRWPAGEDRRRRLGRLEELQGEKRHPEGRRDPDRSPTRSPRCSRDRQPPASSAAVLGTVGALMSDSDDPNIQKIGHFTTGMAVLHGVGMKRIAEAGAAGWTMVRSMALREGPDFVRFLNPEALIPAEVKAELGYADLNTRARRGGRSSRRRRGRRADRGPGAVRHYRARDHGEAATQPSGPPGDDGPGRRHCRGVGARRKLKVRMRCSPR
jgi:hypothetical protein